MPEGSYTDLIDVSDVAPVLDEEKLDVNLEAESYKPSAGDFSIASLQDRFSALFIDLCVLYVLYAISVLIYCYTFIEIPPFFMPLISKQGLIFHGIVLFIFFLYFFITELFFGATIGKAICKLSIRMTDGRPLGKLSSLFRNLFKPLDLVLLPINIIIIEKTSWQQRIGDILSRTVVIKYLKQRRKAYNPNSGNLASASGRFFAFIIDFALIAFFTIGLLMQLNNDKPFLSLFIVLFLPIALIFGISFCESIFGTSPGKWIFGYVICKEDGTKTEWTQSIIRTVLRVYDNNPFGFLCIYLSNSKQRPGDISASTFVIKQRRELKGLACLVLFSGICILGGYLGLNNPDSLLLEKKIPTFLVKYRLSAQSIVSQIPKRLSVVDLKFAIGNPTAVKLEPYFNAGDKIFISFLVDGYALSGNNPWLSQDLNIKYPDGSNAIQLENLVEFKSELTTTGPVMMENNFELPANSPAGRYTLVLTINDKLKNNTLKRHYFFYVRNPQNTSPMPPRETSEINNNTPPPAKEEFSSPPEMKTEEPVRPYPLENEKAEDELMDKGPRYAPDSDTNIDTEEEKIRPNIDEEDETSGM